MKRTIRNTLITLIVAAYAQPVMSAKTIEMETTIIKGNKEQPGILYIVPWKEVKNLNRRQDHKLVLHSLFGDLFTPLHPDKKIVNTTQ